ncbi:uncharacterized protein LOC127541516 [Antechinus flavipes]|uniref:uncharacterized protein LOC127541516 n=1 Tax=Antechinus flavipes TaxID=38775 RepID=UPI0022364A73|nr:uncharacterized protein LOC127541516 [Antechinus flavipes]
MSYNSNNTGGHPGDATRPRTGPGGACSDPAGTPAPTGRALGGINGRGRGSGPGPQGRQAGEPRSNRRRGRKGAERAGGGGGGGGYRGPDVLLLPSFPPRKPRDSRSPQRFSPHLTLSQQPQPPQSSKPFFTSAASAASADSPRPAQEPRVTSGSGRSTSCGRQSHMIGWRSWPTWASGRGRASPVRLPPGETSYTGLRSRVAAVPTYPPRSRRCSCISAFDSLAFPCPRRPVYSSRPSLAPTAASSDTPERKVSEESLFCSTSLFNFIS